MTREAEKILSSVANSIRQNHGIIQEDEKEEESESSKPFDCDIGFPKGFGNDDWIIGLFFTQESRAAATEEILSQWGNWGVRAEPSSSEFRELAERRAYCDMNFNEEEFQTRFDSMTHAERLAEIQVLRTRGIEFEMTDSVSGVYYSSVGANTTFCVAYMLGFIPKFLQLEWRSYHPDAMTMK